MSVDDLRTATWITYVEGRAKAVRVRRCRLEVMAGPDVGLVRDIEAPIIRMGGLRGNDVELSDRSASGLHCEVHLSARGYRLCDLSSTNGTFVAGLRVNDVYLPPGAVIGIGATTKIRFQPLGDSVEVPLSVRDRFGDMVGRSVKMRELFARLDRLAASGMTVLITGETGVGKELVAESLHACSERKDGPFEILDCGAIPPNLIESQLFGHERGAFTGATTAFAGVFERADRGTVFLDEVGELPLEMQPKLLRVLERREVRRIGGARTIPVDIRVVAATNRDLRVEVNRGRFREDLYYRLAVAQVDVPALRERREDIPALIEHILAQLPGDVAALAPETINMMMRHDWPGNVRELRNVIERAVLLSEAPSEAVMARGTPPLVTPDRGRRGDRLSMAVDTSLPFKQAKQEVVSEFERRYIRRLLEEHDGNITQAARAAGLDRMSLHKILNRLKLDNPGRS